MVDPHSGSFRRVLWKNLFKTLDARKKFTQAMYEKLNFYQQPIVKRCTSNTDFQTMCEMLGGINSYLSMCRYPTQICTQNLKVLSKWPIFYFYWLFWPFLARYDQKSVLSHSTYHAKVANMQHTHIFMQDLKVLSKKPILWLF